MRNIFIIWTIFCFSEIIHARYYIDLSSEKKILSAVRGQNPYRSGSGTFRNKTFEISSSAIARRPAVGLDADTYDWRDVNSGVWNHGDRTTTLEFLEYCRDYDVTPFFTANMIAGGYRMSNGPYYCQPDFNKAADLASDWVHYTNFILQNYRQGDTIPNSKDNDLLNSISNWEGKNKLLYAQGSVTPKVIYWEIGNEPELSNVSDFIYNHYLSPSTYDVYYRSISQAMLNVDLHIKVGPCIINPSDKNGSALWLRRLAANPQTQIDFVSYHQYHWGLQWAYNYYSTHPQAKQLFPDNELYSKGLSQMKSYFQGHAEAARSILNNYNRSAEIRISEWSPTLWNSPVSLQLSMAQALGIVEGIFTFVELDISSANFWEWPSEKPSTYAMFEVLRDYMGDSLIINITDLGLNTDEADWRIYFTKNDKTGDVMIWGLNFNDTEQVHVELSLNKWDYELESATLKHYGVIGEDTSLLSTSDLGWDSLDITQGFDINNLNIILESSELTLLVLEARNAVPEPSTFILFMTSLIILTKNRDRFYV